MKPDHVKEMLPIITAYAEGKTIQLASANGGWTDIKYLDMAYPASHFRIKPEPRVFYIATCIRDTGMRLIGDTVTVDESTYNIYKDGGNAYWEYTKAVEVQSE